MCGPQLQKLYVSGRAAAELGSFAEFIFQTWQFEFSLNPQQTSEFSFAVSFFFLLIRIHLIGHHFTKFQGFEFVEQTIAAFHLSPAAHDSILQINLLEIL
ncbi:hypothetical protein Nepgr_014329 [Nepenthes gracilis]|uniref:Uncharacterized protein n=1 Tax=Nepenthes gracilis TaxID=150966 RepID=A0AAD3SJT4_NEPGR|nr:hypothetical protein Nepgr_014329 [Nepenthes gracilis]